MNYFEQNDSFMKSMRNLFVQSHWLNHLQVIPSIPNMCSPLSSSTTSFSSPIKNEMSDQDEPLNLSVKESSNINCLGVNNSATAPTMPLFLSPMFHTLFSKQLLYNSQKFGGNYFINGLPILSNQDFRSRRTTSVKIKKSRSFKCNQCRSMFACLSVLSEHTQREHGGYRCHICDTSFTQRSNLQRHALRHVGFKPYKCSVCCKEYYRKDHLIRHISFNHPTVNPKENIIQRLSSSESLNFIDHQGGMALSTNEHFVLSSHDSLHFYDQSFTTSNDDGQSGAEDNVFLSNIYTPINEIGIDVMN